MFKYPQCHLRYSCKKFIIGYVFAEGILKFFDYVLTSGGTVKVKRDISFNFNLHLVPVWNGTFEIFVIDIL